MPDYLITVRSISNGAFTDSPGATTFLKLDDTDGAPFNPALSMPPDDWVREVIGQVVKSTDATGVLRGDVLAFIHGYNNSMACPASRSKARPAGPRLRRNGDQL